MRTVGRVIALLAVGCVVAPAAWADPGGGGGGRGASASAHGAAAGVGGGPGTGSLMGRGTINRTDATAKSRGASQSARAMVTGPVALGARERRSYARALVREHADLLAFDPRDQLIVRNQIVALPSGVAALQQAAASGFRIVQDATPEGFDAALVVLEAPPGTSLGRALKRLRKTDPQGIYDFNHVYFESGTPALDAAAATVQSRGAARTAVRIGLVDAGLAPGHPALQGLEVRRHGCDGRIVPSTHGTAVASLMRATLAASDDSPVQLYAADVYCGQATGGAVTSLVTALGWLVQQDVPVINVSLVGPPNALLQRAVQAARDRGVLIVAAVGNDGPSAPPLYPASYPGAVAVTGVDGNARLLLEAGRGTHVDFAAPGADIEAASLPEGFAPVRGTSFAAPVVAASLARLLERPDPLLAGQAIATLARSAQDLGAQGYDPKYGYGCVGCPPRQAQAER